MRRWIPPGRAGHSPPASARRWLSAFSFETRQGSSWKITGNWDRVTPMSAAEIIAELPKLTEPERRAVCRRLLELAAENDDYALADASLVEACQHLDRME